MKKALILTYYWPPSGGAGVQRWLRFVKHLRNFGWEPVIYTVDNPQYAVYDESLINEIPEGIETIKLKINEPNNFFAKLSFLSKNNNSLIYNNQQQKDSKMSILQKTMWFIRGNLFIPDARCLWIKPSVKYLSKVLANNHYDIIVSSGPPHSLHLIAKELKEKFNIPWYADFRDPWTSMDYLKEMFLTTYAKRKHMRLEKSIIDSADEIIVVGRTMFNEFKENYNRDAVIIYNGYNEIKENSAPFKLDEKFTIVHIGSFLKNRNCNDLWEVLSEMVDEDKSFSKNFEIKLVGKVDSIVLDAIEKYNLNAFLNKIDYVPFEKTQEYLYSAQILLLPIDRIANAEFVLTGKLFEYLKSKRPILLLGPTKGDAADILQSCKAGYCCDFDDKETIKKTLYYLYNLYLENNNNIDSVNVTQFSGYELTKKLALLFDNITKTN